MTQADDGLNASFVTADDLRNRAERASTHLDDLFRLSTLVHEIRLETDHPVVSAALGMVSERLSTLTPQAFAVAEYARDAAVAGALTGEPPEGDSLNRPELTIADLRARTRRASVRVDIASRLLEHVSTHAEQCDDPTERAAWWRLFAIAANDSTRAYRASNRAWNAYTTARDADAGTSDGAPGTDNAAPDIDLEPTDAARMPGLDPDNPRTHG
ncbi:hypothetical protein [Frankia sp. Cj3]|uniref:hypothetical protein n=1 Tax=Frankia sp. Cj3 TaxID=2880976 RepID=UPI001EF3D8CF|nr:hypothetical protein [Frankia sp. Cj3]